jgi:DNA-binding HxlR family transcriptional regulator
MVTIEKQYPCPVEVTIEAIGGKWKCVILWWLRRDTKRFGELRLLMPKIAQKVLTQQLRELEREGLVDRVSYSESPPRVEYSLTAHGQTLIPITELMCEWGKSHLINYRFGYCGLENVKVLVVADEADSLCLELKAHQATAIAGTAIDEILALLDHFEPDALLVDLDVLNDEEVQLLINRTDLVGKRLKKSIAIVAVIPAINSDARRRTFCLGFALHLSKPVETSEMVATLASLTGKIN